MRCRLGALLVLVLLVLAACGDDEADVGTVGPSGDSVDGREFLSRSVAGRDLVEDTQIRLSFEDGQLGASAGCNSLGAPYAIDDTVLVIEGGMSMTEMGCDPPSLHDQDQWLAEFLGSSPTLVLEGDTLTLTSEGVTIELLDREVADPDQPLIGTRWVLDTIVDGEAASSVPGDAEAEIVFTEDGTFEFFDGCNDGRGAVEVTGGELQIGEVVTEGADCPDEAAEQVRSAVRTVFVPGTSVTYMIEGPRLTVSSGDHGLSFQARP